jgi:anti-anti-sigma factor
MLNVNVKDLSDAVILQCSGRLVRGEETALLCSAVQQHGRTVILDLQGVEAIDAAGIGVLVSLQAAGVYLKLLNPTAPVRELLRITKLESVFEICDAVPVSKETEEFPANADPVACCAQE